MNSTRNMLDIVQVFLAEAIKRSGRTPRFFGAALTPSEAASSHGGLPIFFEVVRQEVAFLGENNWLRGFDLEPCSDPKESLIGVKVVCQTPDRQDPRYPVVAIFDKALSRAIELSPEPDSIELAELLNPSFSPEVLRELSINRWPEVCPTGKTSDSPRI